MHAVRDLAIGELVIGGDCWDRGPRGDRVVEYIRRQPNVAFVWGNHDASWLGACLGHEALIANVRAAICSSSGCTILKSCFPITSGQRFANTSGQPAGGIVIRELAFLPNREPKVQECDATKA